MRFNRPVGWRNESYRHYLASQGVRTAMYYRSKNGKLGSVHGIPIVAHKIKKNHTFPVSWVDVKRRIGQMPKENVKGITKIEFTEPKTPDQKNAWAQYVRGRRALLVFSQPKRGDKVDGRPADEVREHMLDYVLPHEVGHHIALYKKRITDKDLAVAEARADAHVVGMAADDKDVKALAYHASKWKSVIPSRRLDKNVHLFYAKKVDLKKYSGTWKQVSVKPKDPWFQKGLKDVTATYRVRPDGKDDVINKGYRDGKLKVAKGVAKSVSNDNRKLEVSFAPFGLFPGDYRIKSVNKDYTRAVVKGGNYTWVLGR